MRCLEAMRRHGVPLGAAVFGTIALAGCGTTYYSPDNSPSTKLGNLLAFNSRTAPALPTSVGPEPTKTCPDVIVLEGTAAKRVFAGGESADNLRYQFAVTDAARQCFISGSQLSIKIGIEGRVLLGPAGSPGTFSVPVRVAILNEKTQAPIISKLYPISATIAPGQGAADFSFITEPLVVPSLSDHPEDDYSVKLGVDAGGPAVAEKSARRRKRT